MPGLFDFINMLNKKTEYPSNEDLKGFSPWMINRFFSCSPSYYPLAVECNKYQNISTRMVFDLYYFGIPKNKEFLKYNAQKAKAESELQLIMNYFNVNLQIAKDYQQLLSKEELAKIMEIEESKLGTTEKISKKKVSKK